VNSKLVSLCENLSDRDKEGMINEQRKRATTLTRLIFDEGDEMRERSLRQLLMGWRMWLCNVKNVLASTVIGIFLLTMITH
jgi:hypothetical protein